MDSVRYIRPPVLCVNSNVGGDIAPELVYLAVLGSVTFVHLL